METTRILVISKDQSSLRLADRRGESPDWRLETVSSGWEALERVHSGPGPEAVVLDLSLGDSDGLHTLRWLRRVRPDLPVVLVTASEDPNLKLESMRLGAQDCLVRPLRPQQLESAIRRSLCGAQDYDPEIGSDEIERIDDDMFFVAASPTMRNLRAQAELLAQVNAPVLILGENGSGKDLAARLIHKLSVRSEFGFLKVNCAALPADALEQEIFGAPGNGRSKPSKLELCQGGTLFLDEITEMPLHLQARLLRVLQEGRLVHSSNGNRVEIDVRILAATQAHPEQAIADQHLREDLYYRLSTFTVHVPSLRQRKEEIPLLLSHFMNRLARRYNLPARIFSAAAVQACQRYSWPGNLRELEKFVKRYLVMGDLAPGPSRSEDNDPASGNLQLPATDEHAQIAAETARQGLGPSGLKSLVQSVKGEAERNAIADALERVRWNRKAAARLLKVSYRTLLYKIEQYNMSPPAASFSSYGHGSSDSFRERNLHKG